VLHAGERFGRGASKQAFICVITWNRPPHEIVRTGVTDIEDNRWRDGFEVDDVLGPGFRRSWLPFLRVTWTGKRHHRRNSDYRYHPNCLHLAQRFAIPRAVLFQLLQLLSWYKIPRADNLSVGVHAPLQLVRRDLFGRWMLFLLKERHLELIRYLERGVVEGYIVFENFWNGWLFENRLPWALGLAGAAIDALLWLDVELVGKLFSVVACIFVDAVNRTNTNASCIETVSAKTGYGPRHLLLFYLLNQRTAQSVVYQGTL
jgi:hypothetical protein